ncbi:GlpG protein [Orbus hercynius]|uniref:GlpG protein n=1 Tax=Orbus hercynius TaxID=593135 RepID=A0A495RIT0_9GAMM|nr:rhomboid family intramembrane serine protease GlpG [Orbus hercynius]RKS87443.1 GlpG protein [Orbus hercynius]
MYLISFKEAQFAYTFMDYMASKGVRLHVELDSQGNSQLFLAEQDLDKLEWVKSELQQFVRQPQDKRYTEVTWQQTKPSYFKAGKKSIGHLLPNIMSAGPITMTVSLVCIALYIMLLLTGSLNMLLYLGYPVPGESAQFWRYITPIFIHFSLMHIIFNLMWWWYLGGMVEKLRGKFKLLEITIVAGVLSNYAQAAISGPDFGGLSGVVYALMGYVWLYSERLPSSGLYFERAMIVIAVLWLVAGYIGLLGPIANTAHSVGLVVGLLLAAKDIWLLKSHRR